MSDSTEQKRSPRLAPGDRVGPHTVRRFLGDGPLGERYAAVFGTTKRLHLLVVPAKGAPDPDYEEALRAAAPVARIPCVAHRFAAGRDGDLPWLRSELPGGAPEWTLSSPLDPDALPPEEHTEKEKDGSLRVRTFGDLLRAAGEDLSPRDRDRLLGDVAEGLADLHAAGLACLGALDANGVALDRFAGTRRPIARILSYAAIPPGGAAKAAASDVAQFAALVRLAAAPAPGRRPDRARAALLAFADRAEGGAFPAVADARDAFYEVLRDIGSPHEGHRDPDGADPAVQKALPPPEVRGRITNDRRRRRPGSLSGFASTSEAAHSLFMILRSIVILVFVVGFGFGLYYYLTWSDERNRAIVVSDTLSSYSAVSVIPLSDTEAGGEAALERLDGVFDLPEERLRAEADAGNVLAIARRALESLGGGRAPDHATLTAAVRSMRPVMDSLQLAAREDPDAGYLYGHALLLGLGRKANTPAAMKVLEEAAGSGSLRAWLLLGDLYASTVPLPPGQPEDRLSRDRRAMTCYREAGGTISEPTRLWLPAADRIAAIMRRSGSVSDFPEDYALGLRAAANAGHIPSMAVLAVPGPYASENPGDLLEWLRRINANPGVSQRVRAWAQARMGRHFAEGIGTRASDASARIWYERAAALGDRDAMIALAEFCETGRGLVDASGGGPNPAAAAAWRERAHAALPPPSFAPVLLPLPAAKRKE